MSSERRRYFDNAATSFPKPPQVVDAVCRYLTEIGASAGRGAYREAVESGRMLEQTRDAVRRVFRAGQDDHAVFTLNGSDALNIAIKSLLRPGDHALTTVMDHNSVLRPLTALEKRLGIEWTALPVDPVTTRLEVDTLRGHLRPNTRLVVINHASNVTGVLQPIEPMIELCRERGVFFLLDAAQSAGHVPIDFSAQGIDLLACPGHKGLLGPLGTGVLLVRAGVDEHMQTFREGGTGSLSERPQQPEHMPDKLEAGSHNAAGLCGLLAALQWLLARGVDSMRSHELELIERMAARLGSAAGVRWFGPREPEQRVGVFSIRIDGFEPAELSAILEDSFGILTRSGLHCAPLAHQAIGTADGGGTTRLSLGAFLESEDVDAATAALGELAGQSASLSPGT